MVIFMKVTCLKGNLFKLLKNKLFIVFLSLIAVGCGGSNNNTSGQSPTPLTPTPLTPTPLTCADDFQICSPPHLTALYGGGVFYFNEATGINQTVKISEGEKQTFYAIIHDSDISSGESINVTINSTTIDFADSLNGYVSPPLKMDPESIPSALENYTNAEGYEIFNFTLGEDLLLDDKVVGEHEISVVSIDTKGLEGSSKIVVVIENVNDAPVISALTSLDGVVSIGGDVFEVYEGGEEGTIRVAVRDDDIPHGDIIGLNITSANLPTGVISIEADKLSQSDTINNQVEFVVHIASGLLRDADIGEYLLDLLVYDEFGGAEDTRTITLKVNNVAEQPNIISVLAGAGISAVASDNSWILSEDVAGSLSIVVEDEDFGSTENQESLRIDIRSSTLPENFITVQQSEISSPDSSTNNRATFRIEFTAPANQLVGEHNITFSFTDTDGNTALYEGEFRIENVNDAPVISALTRSDGVFSSGENIFEVFEGGEEGVIRVTVRDEDIPHGDIIGLNITSANLPTGVISIEADKLSQSDTINNQVEFVVHIASGLLRDADIGEHLLNFLVYDEFGGAEDSRTITLKVNNVVEQPNIISVLAGAGVSASADGSSWILSEDVAGSLSIAVEDEDFGSAQNQESINITITSPTLSENFITVQQSEISRPDSSTNNRVTFRIEFTAPANQLVGEHNITFSFTDTTGNIVLYKREFRIENVNDVPEISMMDSARGVTSNGENIFEVYEGGEDGIIRVKVRDVDIQHGDIVSLSIISTDLSDIISIEEDKLSQSDAMNNQVEFVVHIASGLLRDADIGEHLLNFLVYDEFGGAEDTRTITLKVNNVVEQPNIISVLAGAGVSASADDSSWILSEDVAGSLSIVVEDEDFGSVQNQESINITITSPTLPENFITVQQSEISRPDSSTNNRVTFRIEFAGPANELVGEHNITFSFTDTDGNIVLYKREFRIENVNDVPEISMMDSARGVTSSGENIFEVYEGGEEGIIRVKVRDTDIQHGDIVSLNITSANLPAGIISIEADKLSQSDAINNQVEFVVHIASGLLRDADIGEHLLNFLVYDEFGKAEDSRTITLKVNNVVEEPNIISVLAGEGVSASTDGSSWILSEDVAGSLSIAVEDEDFGSAQNQESINITITSPTLPENFITVQQSEISRPDSSTNNRVTFRIEFTAPANQLVGEHNITFSFTDTTGNIVLYKREFRIENVNDVPEISMMDSARGVTSNGENIFEVYEGGEDGIIRVKVRDVDIQHGDIIGLNITGANLPTGIISIEKDKLSQSDVVNNQVEFVVHIASGLLRDADIGEHLLNFLVYDEFGKAEDSRTITLKVNNVVEQPNIISVLAGAGVSASADGNSWILSEDVAGSLSIVVEDEDFGSTENQESINITITSPTLPENFITVQQSEISSPDSSTNNRVTFRIEFTAPANQLVGEHNITFSFTDIDGNTALYEGEFRIENVNDAPVISALTRSDGVIANGENIFEVYEGGEDGIIRVKVRDADIPHGDIISLNITGANLPTGVISIEKDKLSQSDTINNQVEFVVHIASGLLRDADIGEHLLNFLVYDEFGGAEDTRTITLKVNNVVEQPNIISVLAGAGVSASANNNSWILSEDVAGSLSIVVEDEDFGSVQNQESINITIMSPTLPENFITVPQSEISRPDSSTNNRATFRIEFASPANELVGEHNITFSFTDTDGNIVLYKREFRIENVNDVPEISMMDSARGVTSSGENIFEVYEGGEEGIIRVAVRDADIQHGDIVGLNITSANLPAGIISIEKDKLSQSDTINNQVEFVLNVASGLLRDADIGEYLLDLLVYDEFGKAEDSRTITLKVNNVVEQPNIISVLAGAGVSASVDGNSWILSEDVAGSLSIVVEDEDFGSVQNQESINITITSPTLPENFITVPQSEISRPDSPTNNRVTFRIEFASPTNQLVGEHNITFSFTDTDENIALYKGEFKIENVNDAPVISALTSLDGVVSIGGDVFEVFEGGDNGTIKVIVNDADIQHGDVVGLNITGANLPTGVISIEANKLSQSDAINNQVEFIVRIASELLQDSDTGEYSLDFLVYDELGKAEDSRTITLKVINIDDASSATYSAISGGVSKLDSVDDSPDIFAISEGQSGQIKIAISDEDLIHSSQLEYTITGDSIRQGIRVGLLNITRVEPSSSAEEHIFLIDIGKSGSPIDDADIGSYNLNLRVENDAGTVNANYPFILKVNNVVEQPNIISVLAGAGVSASADGSSWTLSEDVAGSLSIVVEDEDFGSPQNQESINITIMSPTLPENFITVPQSEISRPDSSTNNRVTFRIEFTAPANQLVGEHNITFSFTDTTGNIVLYKREFRIENVNDVPEISMMDSARGVTSNGENIFEVYEGGEEGIIRVKVRDVDIQHGDIVSLNLISADLPGIISIEEDKLSQSDALNNQVEFVLNVASGLLRDADIGEHQFRFLVHDEFGGIDGSGEFYSECQKYR